MLDLARASSKMRLPPGTATGRCRIR